MIDFKLKQIGTVKSGRKEACLYPEDQDLKIDRELALDQYVEMEVSEIVVDEEYAGCLDGIEEFSHVIVLFLTQFTNEGARRIKRVHPGGFKEFPVKGIFSTRSPVRPNPIGLTVVELLERRENVLVLKGLDAIDDTEVLDIKPFISFLDMPEDPKDPKWILDLFDYIAKEKGRLVEERKRS
ncbi:MAG: tRNA (N6-threonylcarbamoyladenosine(37)-N6)-methyltransferase TrmO [Deltaproteobacteria bacterium]|uniref:tRNA (N6-threonylcarbamoyladenosine(37)-N6)-methyltransferase TrmO n=1 Tax=Candidatus Zymogenus saltonus TaxID=2844893 RepID=A0A9D8PM21_9DELT|nr:tRNA (N6-threonylcarbamoyladenosine(37)-N6)-methyltransferase TrmO [Candidatus Zymogenus saltonus]